jgi:phosphate transport system protein
VENLQRHFERDLERLTETLLRLGSRAERAIGEALRALTEKNADIAREVMRRDEELDQLELEVDLICTDLLALRQPIARDLRFIVTALKIAPEIERIGDLAGNISERAIELVSEPQLKPLIDIPRMGSLTQGMVRDSLDAFVRRDAKAAGEIIARDDQVDAIMEQLFRELLYMLETRTRSRALRLMMVAKYRAHRGRHDEHLRNGVVYLVETRDPARGSSGRRRNRVTEMARTKARPGRTRRPEMDLPKPHPDHRGRRGHSLSLKYNLEEAATRSRRCRTGGGAEVRRFEPDRILDLSLPRSTGCPCAGRSGSVPPRGRPGPRPDRAHRGATRSSGSRSARTT